MRFDRLSLHKYGHFDDCDLEFPKGEMDFHLIFGANEAGKSTTLAAVSDLLFGFPKSTPYDFRFAGPLLRIGAVLEHDGRSLAVRRRKGNKDTLLDESDTAMAEAPLQAMLQGFSAEPFRISHSLDHRRLRDGGRAILDARDDVGQALFAAGSGLVGVQGLLKDLEAEADGIWAPRRSLRRRYVQAQDELSAAQARLKAAQVRPKEWIAARDDLARLTAAQVALEAQRSTQQAALRRVQRIRRLAAPVQRRAALLASIADLTPPAFDAEHARIHEQAQQTIAAAMLTRNVAQAAVTELEEQLSTLTVEDTLIAQQGAIDALVAEAGAAAQGADHLPIRERELRALLDDASRLASEVGLAEVALDGVTDRLPSRIALGELQRLATMRSRTETTLEALRTKLTQDRRAADRARAALAEQRSPALPSDAAAALREGERAVSVQARLDERRRDAGRAAQALATAMARLKPWLGDARALATITLPAETEIAAADRAMQSATETLSQESRAVQTFLQAREKLALQRRRFAAGARAVTAEQVRIARAERDALWVSARDALLGGKPADVAPFQAALAAADTIADRRFETVEASAQLAGFDDRLAFAALDIQQAEARAAAAATARADLERAWSAQLARCGLPEMPITAVRQWRADQAEALRQAQTLGEAIDALAVDEAVVGAARTGLLAALPGAKPDAALERLLDGVGEAHARVTTLQAQAEAAEEAAAKAELTVADLTAGAESWTTDWTEATHAAGLTGILWTTMQTHLPLFEQLRGVVDATRDMQGRVSGIRDNQERFAANARALAEACGLLDLDSPAQTVTETLRRRLQQAVADARAVADRRDALRRRLDERGEAERLIGAAEAQLAPLMVIAGTTDASSLSAGIETARMVRAARADVAALEQALIAEGDGRSLGQLLAEVEAVDPDALAAETAQLDRLVGDLDHDVASAAQAVGEARRAFQALDHGADAALAAADAEQARAAMAAEAEAYLVKRAQVVMLKWAVERYRERRQNPLLARASQHFGTLTLGRYTDLHIDLETDQPRLVGLCADGASTVFIDGMSEGTQDQLFLALRLAALEQSLAAGIALPFMADDLFINFDDRRAHAGFKVLGEIARKTQVLFFTHHDHLKAIAEDALKPHTVSVWALG